MRNKGVQLDGCCVSYEFGTLAIEVCWFLIFSIVFSGHISVSAKYRQIIKQFKCHYAMRTEQLHLSYNAPLDLIFYYM